jgi:hypothetical protein
MLHHIEPNYSLKCCTHLIWFEFETWFEFEFELKTLEKINRKGNRNSKKIGKANSAQGSPLSLAPARALVRPCAWHADPACRRKPECPLSLALSLLRGTGLSAPLLSRAPTIPLSAPLTPLVSASLTSRPRSPRCECAHVRAFSGHDWAPAPLLNLAPCSPTFALPFAPSAQLSRSLSLSLSRSAHANREPPPPPIRGRRCARAPSSATVSFALPSSSRDTLRCALPSLVQPAHTHRSGSCVAGAPPSSPHHVHVPPSLPRASSVPLQGEQPPRAPLFLLYCTG